MSDLISRSDVIQILKECNLDETLFEKDVFDKINNLPTSYDVAKVVGGLEKSSKWVNETNEYCDDDGNDYIPLSKAIEIVNRGGVSDDVCEWKSASEYNNGWIPCSEKLPDNDKNEYIVQKTNGFIDILGFTKDAYKLSKYDFAEYKGKKKQLFYDYVSEYGYIECECVAWQPLPEPFKERD